MHTGQGAPQKVEKVQKEITNKERIGGESPPPFLSKSILPQPCKKMKKNFTTIVLVSLVIFNIYNGDFANPSTLDYVKFAIIAIGLALNLALERRRT